jgi:hypothetical protein
MGQAVDSRRARASRMWGAAGRWGRMGWTWACALALAGALAPAGGAAQTDVPLEELADRATRAVVLIDVRAPSGSRQGSGFLVDPSGIILTNHHVVRGARSLRVKLASGDVYDVVTLLAVDERRDLAILQVAGFDLPALPLANSDSVRIGNRVVVIGSPLGLENTVTTGIVSGRRREPEGFQLLQISAPASRGSSGGPVLAADGRVIGVAASQLQSGQNLNFAVPINYARGILDHLGGEPLEVLRPEPARVEEPAEPMAVAANTVNRALSFDLERFAGYSLELETPDGLEGSRRTRIAYRVIRTLGDEPARIERYLESETTRRDGPFDTEQTVRRERVRTLVRADDLSPLSSRGETMWWTGKGWAIRRHDLTFEDGRVRGLLADTTGHREELDRELPSGILLRDMSDLAFATLDVDSLVDRSVEFVTFDPGTGTIANDRYDVREVTRVRAAGETYRALRVNIAVDLANTTAFFRLERPRVLLRRRAQDAEAEEVTTLEFLGR